MRIDAYNQVTQLYQTTQTKTTQTKATASKAVKSETLTNALQLSQTGKDMQVAKQAVNDTPDVREDRVNQIKAQFTSGTYNVTGQELADKLVNNYFNSII